MKDAFNLSYGASKYVIYGIRLLKHLAERKFIP